MLAEKKQVEYKGSISSALLLSSAFCLVFMAFCAAQNAQTSSSDSETRSQALAVLYAFFCVMNLFAAYVVERVGFKKGLFFSSLTYALFVAANIYYRSFLFFIASAIEGIGAAVLWTAQGAYLTRCATHHEMRNELPAGSTKGYFNGLFWSIYQVNQVAGNGLVALLYWRDLSTPVIFTILTIIAVAGCCLLLFLKNIGEDEETVPPRQPLMYSPPQEVAPKVGLMDTVRMWKVPAMALLFPAFIFSGISQAFMYGDFPPLIKSNSEKFAVLAVMGASDALGSFLLGRLSDSIGRLPTFGLGSLSFGAVLAYFALHGDSESALWVMMLMGVGQGIGDAAYNTQTAALLGAVWPDQAETAFANLKFFQALSTAAGFLYRSYISFFTKVMLTIAWLAVSVLSLIYLHLWVLPAAPSSSSSSSSKPDSSDPINYKQIDH